MPAQLIEEDLTYLIIGILYKVHNKLGPLLQEKYYQRAIEQEFKKNKNPSFTREFPVKILFENDQIGWYKIDFLIDKRLVLEIKTLNQIHPKYIDQVLSYMNQLQIRVGLIANFKKDKLWIKRILLPKKYLLASALHPLTSQKI